MFLPALLYQVTGKKGKVDLAWLKRFSVVEKKIPFALQDLRTFRRVFRMLAQDFGPLLLQPLLMNNETFLGSLFGLLL